MTPRTNTAVRRFAWSGEDATQLAEFAVTLPLLVVFVVGIFDFSGAFTLKQKLTNIARDTARAAAADPATDLSTTSSLPYSVNDAFYVLDNYLIANNINDCGVKPANGILVGTLTWQFSVTSTSASPCGIILTINRGYYFPIATPATTPPALTCTPAAANGAVQVVGTCVSIQYAYQWRFGKVVSLLGSSATLPTNITAAAVAMNEN